jgi:acyl dehydratase
LVTRSHERRVLQLRASSAISLSMTTYFEDITIGTKSKFGAYHVTREEVIEFASRYDPQAFHLDDEAAAKTHFGRLSASGWHTGAMTMAMLVENLKKTDQAGLGSPGVDEIRWLKPVYPGDTLRVETEVLEKRRSQSRPEMGIFRSRTSVFNQHDEPVMTLVSIGLIQVRDPTAPN